jgi:hypothetical protein
LVDSSGAHQSIAPSTYRNQISGISGIGFDLGPQTAQELVNAGIIYLIDVLLPPYLLHDQEFVTDLIQAPIEQEKQSILEIG